MQHQTLCINSLFTQCSHKFFLSLKLFLFFQCITYFGFWWGLFTFSLPVSISALVRCLKIVFTSSFVSGSYKYPIWSFKNAVSWTTSNYHWVVQVNWSLCIGLWLCNIEINETLHIVSNRFFFLYLNVFLTTG